MRVHEWYAMHNLINYNLLCHQLQKKDVPNITSQVYIKAIIVLDFPNRFANC